MYSIRILKNECFVYFVNDKMKKILQELEYDK